MKEEQDGDSVNAEKRKLLALSPHPSPQSFGPTAEKRVPTHPGKGVKAFLTANLL